MKLIIWSRTSPFGNLCFLTTSFTENSWKLRRKKKSLWGPKSFALHQSSVNFTECQLQFLFYYLFVLFVLTCCETTLRVLGKTIHSSFSLQDHPGLGWGVKEVVFQAADGFWVFQEPRTREALCSAGGWTWGSCMHSRSMASEPLEPGSKTPFC